jgi:hypothetical protein
MALHQKTESSSVILRIFRAGYQINLQLSSSTIKLHQELPKKQQKPGTATVERI